MAETITGRRLCRPRRSIGGKAALRLFLLRDAILRWGGLDSRLLSLLAVLLRLKPLAPGLAARRRPQPR